MHVLSHQTQWLGAVVMAAAVSVPIAYLDARSHTQELPAETTAAEEALVSADVAIRQEHVDADGRSLPGRSPMLTYRLEHRASTSGPVMTMTLIAAERTIVQGIGVTRALEHSFIAARMERDAKNGLRLFNARGELLTMPYGDGVRPFGNLSDKFLPPSRPSPEPPTVQLAAFDRMVFARYRRADRRARLEQTHGLPAGSVRGLDRYISSTDGDLDEVLVDPDTVLPMEMNTVRDGHLVSRAEMAYDERPDGWLVRRRLRAERVVPSVNGRRVVLDIELSNVRLGSGGAE